MLYFFTGKIMGLSDFLGGALHKIGGDLYSSSAHECAIGEVARSDGGVEYHQKSIRMLFLTACRGDRNVVADKRFIVNIQVCPHEFSTESFCPFCSAFALYYLWQKSGIGCDSAKKQMDLFFLLSSCTIFVPIKRV